MNVDIVSTFYNPTSYRVHLVNKSVWLVHVIHSERALRVRDHPVRAHMGMPRNKIMTDDLLIKSH